MRQAFNFYVHYDEILQDLNDAEFAQLMRAILDVQFFRKHIDHIHFEDRILAIAWKGLKHSIKSQIEGYCNKHNIDYDAMFQENAENTGASTPTEPPCQPPSVAPSQGGMDTPCQAPCQQEKEEEKEKEQEKGKEKGGECERGKESQSKLATRDKFSRNKDSPYLEDAKEVAEYLAERIKRFNPNAKPKPKGWIRDIDLAMRIDGRSKDELLRCIDWIYETPEGSFWIPNILSGKKLREKFDTMQLQAQRSGRKKPLAVLNELHEEGWM